MTYSPITNPAEREDLLRASWLSHDARWFNALAAQQGIEVANRVNREAIRTAGAVEARRVLRRLGGESPANAAEFLAFTDVARDLFVGSNVEMATVATGDRTYEVQVSRCFAAENISRAGLTDSYECGIFDRIEGWHEGLGLPLSEPVPTTLCLLANGQPCTRRLTIAATPKAGSDTLS